LITFFTPGMLVVSGLPSWNAQVNPGTVFGAAYAAEYGSRMALVTRISDPAGGTFNIQDGILVHRDASPWRGALDTTYTTYGVAFTPLQPTRVGINWGQDGLAGTADDVVLTAGTGLVNEIFLFAPSMGDSELGGGSEQQQLSAAAAGIAGITRFTETFTVTFGGVHQSGTAIVGTIPEPGTFVLLGGALLLASAYASPADRVHRARRRDKFAGINLVPDPFVADVPAH
jgi:hypothetical protein